MKNNKMKTFFCVLLSVLIVAVGVAVLHVAYMISDNGIGRTSEHTALMNSDILPDTLKNKDVYPWTLLVDTNAEKVTDTEMRKAAGTFGDIICQSFMPGELYGIDIESADIYLCRDMLFVIDCPVITYNNRIIAVSYAIGGDKEIMAVDFSVSDKELGGENDNIYSDPDYRAKDADTVYWEIADILSELSNGSEDDLPLQMDEIFYKYVGKYDITVDFMAEYCNYLKCISASYEDAYRMAHLLSNGERSAYVKDGIVYTEIKNAEMNVMLRRAVNSDMLSGITMTYSEQETEAFTDDINK